MGDAVFVQYTTSACSFDGSNCVRFSILRGVDCILKDIILLVRCKTFLDVEFLDVEFLDLEFLDLEVVDLEFLDLEVVDLEVLGKGVLCMVCDASPPHR
jgi:hypothetical protein